MLGGDTDRGVKPTKAAATLLCSHSLYPSPPSPPSLSPGGTIVTYGGLARKPVALGAGALIFRDIRACGWWLSSPARRGRRVADMEGVARLLQDGVIKTE